MSVTKNKPLMAARFWDEKSLSYKRYKPSYNDIEGEIFAKAKAMGIDFSGRIIDCGAGSGVYTLHMAQMSKDFVFALDISPRMLLMLQKDAQSAGISNVNTLCLDWEDFIKLSENDFDLAFLTMAPLLRSDLSAKAFINLGKQFFYMDAISRKNSFLEPILKYFALELPKPSYDFLAFLQSEGRDFKSEIFLEKTQKRANLEQAIALTVWKLREIDAERIRQMGFSALTQCLRNPQNHRSLQDFIKMLILDGEIAITGLVMDKERVMIDIKSSSTFLMVSG